MAMLERWTVREALLYALLSRYPARWFASAHPGVPNQPGTTYMNTTAPLSEYLVISRGQWDPDRSPVEIQDAIDRFYDWHDQQVAAGRMRAGQRLAREGKLVTPQRTVDGPFAEAKEVIGGYWFILAGSLEEAARLAADNPCLECGLAFEIRPIEPQRASAFAVASETPAARMPSR